MKVTEDERIRRMQRKYGLTSVQWYALWDACKGHCPACRKPFSSVRLACVDHNHLTGLVRGLLCTPCNYAIGERHDDAPWFRAVAEYLDHPPSLAAGISVYVPGSIGAHRAG